jgi:hypothetical protein
MADRNRLRPPSRPPEPIDYLCRALNELKQSTCRGIARRRRPRRPVTPAPNPGEQAALTAVVQALIGRDEVRRQATMIVLREKESPLFVRWVVGHLVQVLQHGNQTHCRQATAALIGLGGQALCGLHLALRRCRSSDLRGQLIQVLEAIAPQLDELDRMLVLDDLISARCGVAGEGRVVPTSDRASETLRKRPSESNRKASR